MAKKRSKAKMKLKIKFDYDAPVTLTFTLLSLLLFLIDLIFLENKLDSSFFMTSTVSGDFQFSFASFNSYLRLFLYVFGRGNTIFFFSRLVIITLLGPRMEERFGSGVIGIMILVSTLFTGVLSACSCKLPFNGADPIVFMLILLDMLFHISKKTVSLSSALATALFIACLFVSPNQNGMIGVLVVLAGGLCGSLFAFMASPKTRAKRPVKKEDTKSVSVEPPKSLSPEPGNSDETVVGSIKF